MQEELDYLEETIPKLSDEDLINILAVNAEAYGQLALDFAIEELRVRGFKLKQINDSFEIVTPANDTLILPRKVNTSSGANASPAYLDPAVLAGHTTDERVPVGVGGWLGLLVLDLVILSPISFLALLYAFGTGIDIIRYYPVLGCLIVLDRVMGLTIAGFNIYAGVRLYQIHPDAVRFAKRLFIISASCVTAVSGLIYMAASNTDVQAFQESARSNFLLPLFSVWISCAVWYLYLTHSKRVAATYGLTTKQDTH